MKRPEPGQIWRRIDMHGGDAHLVVVGKEDARVWELQGFNWNGSYWMCGRKRFFTAEDFKQCEYIGILPPPKPNDAKPE